MIKSSFDNISISGVSCAVPQNKDVIADTFSEQFGEDVIGKFSKMTGVQSRYITHERQTASDLAYEAAISLLKNKNIRVEAIGAIVFVTQTPDYRLPSSSTLIHKRLGLLKDCVAFDVNLGCSGYTYGLYILSSLMANSNIEKGLLLAADTATKFCSPLDRSSSMLFGDAGSATLLEKTIHAPQMNMGFRTDGEGYNSIIIPAGAYRNMNAPMQRSLREDGNIRSDYELLMNGTDVFNFTISEIPKMINDFMNNSNTQSDSYDSFVFHQANHYILKQVAKRCAIAMDKVPVSIDRYGNTSVASIPLTLCDKYGNDNSGKFKSLLCGFGVGLSWGTVATEIDRANIYPIFETNEYYQGGGLSHS